MPKIHIDTDLGGDIDDICALALVLRWPDADIVGITTVADDNGIRAGYVRYILALEGRTGIPVAAGADSSQPFYRDRPGLPPEKRYWPEPVTPFPTPLEDALALLKFSIEQDAIIVAIGPYTNLYLLDIQHPGILNQANLFLMGGYIYPTRPGYPKWGNDFDYNIQVDVKSAHHVIQHSNPTLIPLTVTVETALRRAYLASLRASGPLGNLIAHQAEMFAEDEQYETKHGQTCDHLPNDLINFQHDPLACAIALGYTEGVEITELPLRLDVKDTYLTERIDPTGKPTRVVTGIDGPRFSDFWLERIAPHS
jgi:inosine-uridine nucleoside N-ribohydrolase